MAGRLRGIHAGIAGEPKRGRDRRLRPQAHIGFAGIGADHVPRRIADHRIEAGAGETTAVAIEEHFGELELPVKQAAVGARLIRRVQIAARCFCGERASTRQRGVR